MPVLITVSASELNLSRLDPSLSLSLKLICEGITMCPDSDSHVAGVVNVVGRREH